jgi:hypothetical protein
VSRAPDAWTALRGRPWRFLGSAWPWRSAAYLVTSVPLGLLVVVVLGTGLLLGVLTLVVVVGVAVLAGLPVLIGVLGAVERRRLALVQPPPAAVMSPRERFRIGRRLPLSWSEAGYAVLFGTVLWWVDFAVLVLVGTVPPVLMIAPLLVRSDEHLDLVGLRVDTPAEAWLATAAALPALVLAAYAFTALAAGQAALARLLLDPREAELAAAVADLRRSRVELVDASRPSAAGSSATCTTASSSGWCAHDDARPGRVRALRRTGARPREERTTSRPRTRWRTCAAPCAASTRGCSSTTGSRPPSTRSPTGARRRSRSTSTLDERLPAPIEAAAYFVVSEALTNVERHARARRAEVHAWVGTTRWC